MSGKYWPRTIDVAAALARLKDSLVELCAFAESYNITLCLENFDQHPYSKDCLVGPTPMAAKLAEEVKLETANFGLLPDLSHTPIIPEAPRFMVESAAPYIVRSQIGNGSNDPYSEYYGDDHPYFGAARTQVGLPQLVEFLQALVDVGFLNETNPGIVGFEIKPKPGENPEAIMAGSERILKDAWKQVILPQE
jgi:sugar phosphate isomerase/epimerase